MDTIYRVFVEVMLWGALPIYGVLGFWEEHLTISDSNRRLIQLLLLLGIFGWVWFWNSQANRIQMQQMKNTKSYFSFDNDQADRIDRSADSLFNIKTTNPSRSADEVLFDDIEEETNVSIHH